MSEKRKYRVIRCGKGCYLIDGGGGEVESASGYLVGTDWLDSYEAACEVRRQAIHADALADERQIGNRYRFHELADGWQHVRVVDGMTSDRQYATRDEAVIAAAMSDRVNDLLTSREKRKVENDS
jgi:hypothetical protein